MIGMLISLSYLAVCHDMMGGYGENNWYDNFLSYLAVCHDMMGGYVENCQYVNFIISLFKTHSPVFVIFS